MHLSDYVAWYARKRDLKPSSEDQYARHVRCFCADIGQVDVGDLTAAMIAEHLRNLRRKRRSDSYRRSRKVHLLALLRSAARDRSLPTRPRFPRRGELVPIRIKDYTPQGFTWEQACGILAATKRIPGFYGPIPRALWWGAWIPAAWDSGLSPCDLLALHRRSISEAGTLQTVRIKTGSRVAVRFRSSTLAALDATFPPSRDLCFPWDLTFETLRSHFRQLLVLAGLTTGKMKWLRAGSGCDVELQQPGTGHIHLANTSQVFDQHYRVEIIVNADRPMPRELIG